MIKHNLLEEYCKVSRNFYYKNPSNFQSIINGGNEMRDSSKTGKYKILIRMIEIEIKDKIIKLGSKFLLSKFKKYLK